MSIHILIDDIRTLGMCGVAEQESSLTIRTYEEALAFLSSTDINDDILLMDNDLGEAGQGREGYDLLSYTLSKGNCPKEVRIVSSNPVGRSRMEAALKYHGYIRICLSWVRL